MTQTHDSNGGTGDSRTAAGVDGPKVENPTNKPTETNELTRYDVDPRPRLYTLWLGVALVAIAITGLYDLHTDQWLALGARGTDPGPAFLPEMLMWLLLGGGVIQIVAVGLGAWKSGGLAPSTEFQIRKLWMPALLCVSLGAYYWLIPRFGYLVPSMMFALIWVPLIHFRSGDPFHRRHLVQFPLEALVIAGALYALFRYGIRVPLP